MSRYKAVIFDCDGVLVDSEPISNKVLVEMGNELGADIDMKYALVHFKGNALFECMRLISKRIDKELPRSFERDFRSRSYLAFEKDLKAIPGVELILNNINLPIAVASSGPMEKIQLNLKHTDLLKYFEGSIFSCYTYQKWKPDPEVLLKAASFLKVHPRDCLVIEDSFIGVQAAINGGFDVFVYEPEEKDERLNRMAKKSFDSMIKLKGFLNI